MTNDLQNVLQKIEDGRTDYHQEFAPNVFLNDQEKGLIIETLHDELKKESLSQYAKVVTMAIIQKLNNIES